MKLTRFECCGTGLFRLLNYLNNTSMTDDDWNLLLGMEQDFDENMKVPRLRDFNENYKCYFTSKGMKYFKKQLDVLRLLVNRYFDGDIGLEEITVEVSRNSKRIKYIDKYQVVLDTGR